MDKANPSSGDESSFEALFQAHHRAVLAYCARRASPADAWDAASDVFLVAWRRIGEVPEPSEARAWLLGVAFRVLANHRRATMRRTRLFQRVAGTERSEDHRADEPLIRREEEREVVAALERLRPTDRELLLLTLWEELPRAQVATALGISANAFDQRYARARRRLAGELGVRPVSKGRATRSPSRKGGAT